MSPAPSPLAGIKARMQTTAGEMTFEFFPDKAPGHVENFVKLAEKGFYDGTKFHRVIQGFMIQGGWPKGDGTGGPGYSIKAEFNRTPHTRGILSMARTQDPNSAGSQFFVMHDTAPHLDNQYTVFGKVTQGLEVIDKIVNSPKGRNDRPNNPPVIKTIKIEEK